MGVRGMSRPERPGSKQRMTPARGFASHRGRRLAWRYRAPPAFLWRSTPAMRHPCCNAALPALSRPRVVMFPAPPCSTAIAIRRLDEPRRCSASSRCLTHARAPREQACPVLARPLRHQGLEPNGRRLTSFQRASLQLSSWSRCTSRQRGCLRTNLLGPACVCASRSSKRNRTSRV
jgi:hypothetical protein